MEQIAYRTCPLCEACCGLEIVHSEARVISIRGNKNDVFSKGYICPKGAALKDLQHDPDRLRQPQIKRNGKFESVSWDEAFAEIAKRLPPLLNNFGADSIACVAGNPVVHKIGLLLYFARMAKILGSKNIYSASTLDQMPKQLSCALMFGSWFSVPVPDIERSQFLLILGANPMVSNGSLWTVPDFRGKARAMRARGGRIVVIDPRRTETAEVADEHHFIRPGSDVFLLLGMVHTLFAEELVRPGHLQPHLAGLDELQQAVTEFAPEQMAGACGIAADTIRALARALANTEAAAIYGRIGTCTQEFGTLCSWLIDVINILCGKLDVPGGAMFPKAAAFAANTEGRPGIGRGAVTGRRHARVSGAPEVLGEFPLVCLAEEIETPGAGQIKALISVASNPVLSAPNGARLGLALEQLDFMLSIDIYLNETTRHADVILPGLSPLEDSHFDAAFPQFAYRNYARFSPAVFDQPQDQVAEWQILLRIAGIIAGKPADFDVLAWDQELLAEQVRKQAGPQADGILAITQHLQGPERQIELALRSGPYGDRFGLVPAGLHLARLKAEPNGIDLGPLQARVPEILRTPSGKIELAAPMLIADLARVKTNLGTQLSAQLNVHLNAPAAASDQAVRLQLIGRRDIRSGNSWMHNLPSLAKGPYRCNALVNPQDAARANLADGAQALLQNTQGQLQVQIVYSDAMMPGVISLPHGWGHDEPDTRMATASLRPGVNMNSLLSDQVRDMLSGNAVLSGIEVSLHAIK